MTAENILFAIEIIGTVAFAITGVITSVEKKFDVFGAIVLGTVTAVGGGIVRDLILGYTPPMAFRKSVYAITAVITSLAVFVIAYFFGRRIKKHFNIYSQVINIFDSIGLSVFVVGGVNSAIACGFGENMFLAPSHTAVAADHHALTKGSFTSTVCENERARRVEHKVRG